MNGALSCACFEKVMNYNPETGEFRWRVSTNKKIKVGELVGSVDKCSGYLRIKYQGKSYQAHRLAWLLTHGKWPDGVIDHIDGDKLNNRVSNIRDVSHAVNMQNQKKAQSHNKTGFLGVHFDIANRSYVAMISINNKQLHLGRFSNAEEAYQVYLEAKHRLHPGNTIQLYRSNKNEQIHVQ